MTFCKICEKSFTIKTPSSYVIHQNGDIDTNCGHMCYLIDDEGKIMDNHFTTEHPYKKDSEIWIFQFLNNIWKTKILFQRCFVSEI